MGMNEVRNNRRVNTTIPGNHLSECLKQSVGVHETVYRTVEGLLDKQVRHRHCSRFQKVTVL